MTLRQPTFGHGGTARSDEEVTIMVSKALASLGARLELAEWFLQEQREDELLAFRSRPSQPPEGGGDQ